MCHVRRKVSVDVWVLVFWSRQVYTRVVGVEVGSKATRVPRTGVGGTTLTLDTRSH